MSDNLRDKVGENENIRQRYLRYNLDINNLHRYTNYLTNTHLFIFIQRIVEEKEIKFR